MFSFCDVFKVLVAIIIPNAGGLIGGYFFGPQRDGWSDELVKPALNPPNWLFLPVWTTLYILMGIASYLVYYHGAGFTGKAQVPLLVYIITLIFNFAWTPVYFGMHNIFGGLLIITAMTTSVTICGVLFAKIDKIAGLLFVPYVAWLSIATYISYEIVLLNPDKIYAKLL